MTDFILGKVEPTTNEDVVRSRETLQRGLKAHTSTWIKSLSQNFYCVNSAVQVKIFRKVGLQGSRMSGSMQLMQKNAGWK